MLCGMQTGAVEVPTGLCAVVHGRTWVCNGSGTAVCAALRGHGCVPLEDGCTWGVLWV